MEKALTPRICPLPDVGWAEQIAADIVEVLQRCLRVIPKATLALSGGTTPEPVYAALSQGDLDWTRVCILQVDERVVPANDPRSNATMIRRAMAPALAAGATACWMDRALLGDAPAVDYAAQIHDFLPIDVMVLGMGDDGHTASLFPGDGNTASSARVIEVAAARGREARLSLGLSVLEQAQSTYVIARGASKAAALQRLLAESGDLEETPIRLVRVHGSRDCPPASVWADRALRRAARRRA